MTLKVVDNRWNGNQDDNFDRSVVMMIVIHTKGGCRHVNSFEGYVLLHDFALFYRFHHYIFMRFIPFRWSTTMGKGNDEDIHSYRLESFGLSLKISRQSSDQILTDRFYSWFS